MGPIYGSTPPRVHPLLMIQLTLVQSTSTQNNLALCLELLDARNTMYLWFKFILGLMFFNWFQFHLPLFQIIEINKRQKKIKIKPVLKFCPKTNF